MTPEREALEKPMIVGAVYDTERGPATYHGLDHYIGETTHKFELGNGGSVFIRQQQLDEFLKRAFATPGEPCAWRIRFKNFDEVTTDPAKAERWRKVYPDQKVDPLYTTPQPAAGWDGPRWRHKKRGSTYTEIGRGTLQAPSDGLRDECPVVIYRGDDGYLWVRAEWEFEDGRFESLRREAPAQAEGKNQAELLLNAAMDHIAGTLEQPTDMRAWSHLLIYCPDDVVSARAAARPDTAEARLREALEKIAAMNPDYRSDRPIAVAKVALSPPSGGDEAKESDWLCNCSWGCVEADNCRRREARKQAEEKPITPIPSEPPPPADRREIVARTLSTKFPAILAQYSQYKIAEAILAALAQSDDASRKREG